MWFHQKTISWHRREFWIIPFILHWKVHPFSDDQLKMTWNVTERFFLFLHKILTVENDGKVSSVHLLDQKSSSLFFFLNDIISTITTSTSLFMKIKPKKRQHFNLSFNVCSEHMTAVCMKMEGAHESSAHMRSTRWISGWSPWSEAAFVSL